jgi:hypothetical protein
MEFYQAFSFVHVYLLILVPGSDENHLTMAWCHLHLRVKEGMCGFVRTLLEMCSVISLLKIVICLLLSFTISTQFLCDVGYLLILTRGY